MRFYLNPRLTSLAIALTAALALAVMSSPGARGEEGDDEPPEEGGGALTLTVSAENQWEDVWDFWGTAGDYNEDVTITYTGTASGSQPVDPDGSFAFMLVLPTGGHITLVATSPDGEQSEPVTLQVL